MRLASLLVLVTAAVTPAVPQATAWHAQSPVAFDVVSIKLAEFPNESYFAGFTAGIGACGGSRFTTTGPRVSFGTTTVCSLIRMAYDIKDYQVVSMPPRMSGKEQLKFHREPRQAPVYALVAMKDGTRDTDRPVVDRTGLTGRYAFSLEWSATQPLTGADDRPSLFTAVQEQLGLRLEPATDAVDAFIIDSVERPTPN